MTASTVAILWYAFEYAISPDFLAADGIANEPAKATEIASGHLQWTGNLYIFICTYR